MMLHRCQNFWIGLVILVVPGIGLSCREPSDAGETVLTGGSAHSVGTTHSAVAALGSDTSIITGRVPPPGSTRPTVTTPAVHTGFTVSSRHESTIPFPARFLGWEGVVRQSGRATCGAAALAMLAERLGAGAAAGKVERFVESGPDGASLLSLQTAGGNIGLTLDGWRLRWEALAALAPCIVLYSSGHYVVIDSASEAGDVWLSDPLAGRWWITREVLERLWRGEALVPRSVPGAGEPFIRRMGPRPVDSTETLFTGGKQP